MYAQLAIEQESGSEMQKKSTATMIDVRRSESEVGQGQTAQFKMRPPFRQSLPRISALDVHTQAIVLEANKSPKTSALQHRKLGLCVGLRIEGVEQS